MKFLVDANLPPLLCRWLHERGHEADHLANLGLLTAMDTEICRLAREREAIILSKDFDFYDRALLFGAPPPVLHIGFGNCSTALQIQILGAAWHEVEAALLNGSKLVSVTPERVEIFP